MKERQTDSLLNIEYASKRHSLRLKHSEAHIPPQYSYEKIKRVLLDKGRRDGQCAERCGADFFRLRTDEDMAELSDRVKRLRR